MNFKSKIYYNNYYHCYCYHNLYIFITYSYYIFLNETNNIFYNFRHYCGTINKFKDYIFQFN